jgi:hypothetical protein
LHRLDDARTTVFRKNRKVAVAVLEGLLLAKFFGVLKCTKLCVNSSIC